MKKYIAIFGLFAAVLGANSCSDYLDETVVTSYSREAIYSSDEGCIGALNAAYSTVATYNGYGFVRSIMSSVMSGVYSSTQWTNSTYYNLAMMVPLATQGWFGTVFANHYAAINSLNDVIDAVESGDAQASDDVKDRIYGDAHLFKAFLYFNIVRMWGDVPLYTERDPSLSSKPRATTFEVYSQIIEDLTVAIEYLNDDMDTEDVNWKGHGSKYSAMGLRAKVYVAMASIVDCNDNEPFNKEGFPEDSAPYWQAAYDDATAVIESDKFELIPSLTTLYDVDNRYSKESLMELTMSSVKGNQSYLPGYLPQGAYGCTIFDDIANGCIFTSTKGYVTIPRETFDAHSQAYPGDPRLNATYIHTGYYENTDYDTVIDLYPTDGTTGNKAQLYCKKHIDPTKTALQTDKNIFLLRYAEIYLIAAEAANELDKTPNEVFSFVNPVLDRARNSDATGASEPSQWGESTGFSYINTTIEDLSSKENRRKAIMQEYVFELHGEFEEFFMVRRRGLDYFKEMVTERHNYWMEHCSLGAYWSVGDDGVGSNKNSAECMYPTEEDSATINYVLRAMLMPIPQEEINTNEYITTNNYGY